MSDIKKFYLILLLLAVFSFLLFLVVFYKSKNIQTQGAVNPLVSTQAVEITRLPSDLPALGNPGATLVLTGFFDLNETRDQAILKILTAQIDLHPRDFQLYFKNLPQPKLFHPDRALPHRALWCAAAQNHYQDFLEKILNNNKLDKQFLSQIAQTVDLNQTAWQNCLTSAVANQSILDDLDQASSLGVQSAPALFVNNKRINLDEGVDVKELIDKILAI